MADYLKHYLGFIACGQKIQTWYNRVGSPNAASVQCCPFFTNVEIKWGWDWQFRKYLLSSNNKWYNFDQLHRLTTIRFNALKTDVQQHDTTDRLTRIQFGQHSTSSSTCEKSSLCKLFSLAGKQAQMNLNSSRDCLKG